MSRVQGYLVKITGFLPVDKSDLQAQATTINALAAAMKPGGDVGALVKTLVGVEIEQKLTSRSVEEPATVAPAKPMPIKKTA